MVDPVTRPARPSRSESREALELKGIRDRQPELTEAVDMYLELIELHRRVLPRVPLPTFELNAGILAQHQAKGQPVLRFEDIPIELTDLRLMVRQTADVLRRFGTLEAADYEKIQLLGRDSMLLEATRRWYRDTGRGLTPSRASEPTSPDIAGLDADALGQVLALAMRPFLARCADVLQQRTELGSWTHPHCALCGGEPDFAVITPAADRLLICSRCALQWRFEPLTCPFCLNDNRARITSFATPDGRYRVYACDACRRYLKAYDARRSSRPVMPLVDAVATLPLDAAAIQRGYKS